MRGVQHESIFIDDTDRALLLALLAKALRDNEARAYAFCLMGNHYHVVLQTARPNLSTLMHRVNSHYSRTFNRRHGRRGHLFDGRFKAVHVDRDAYLLEVCRYVDLNPVRAGLVDTPAQWRWSSYRAHVGNVAAPPWLATRELLEILSGEALPGAADMAGFMRRYADWVEAGRETRLWRKALREKLYLGDKAFVERVKRQLA